MSANSGDLIFNPREWTGEPSLSTSSLPIGRRYRPADDEPENRAGRATADGSSTERCPRGGQRQTAREKTAKEAHEHQALWY